MQVRYGMDRAAAEGVEEMSRIERTNEKYQRASQPEPADDICDRVIEDCLQWGVIECRLPECQRRGRCKMRGGIGQVRDKA